jgi:hypothetical protein
MISASRARLRSVVVATPGKPKNRIEVLCDSDVSGLG